MFHAIPALSDWEVLCAWPIDQPWGVSAQTCKGCKGFPFQTYRARARDGYNGVTLAGLAHLGHGRSPTPHQMTPCDCRRVNRQAMVSPQRVCDGTPSPRSCFHFLKSA